MVSINESKCPLCDSELKYYDCVQRIVRTKGGKTKRVYLRRLRCVCCGSLHRELPDYILGYKQYDANIIQGVVEGLITPETLGYEDYPCEMTMKRWTTQNFQLLL